MNKFSDLGVKPVEHGLQGDKIKIARVLNREIEVIDFKIVPSKYPEKGNGLCLYLQIKMSGVMNVVFTGSITLQEMILQIGKDKFPFTTTIIEDNNDRFLFT